jgi:cytochrome c553
MRSRSKWLSGIALGLAGVLVIAWTVIWGWSEAIISRTHPVSPESVRAAGTPENIAAGKRLAAVTGCSGCHRAELTGGVFADIPHVARVNASNLTLVARQLSDAQLAQSIRQGVRSNGRALFGMPSEMYLHLRDDELAAVLGYLRSLPAGGAATPPIEWRLGGRVALLLREFEPAPVLVAKAQLKRPLDARKHAAGRHTALIACSECHGPDLGGLPGPFGERGTPDLAIAAAYDADAFGRLMQTGIALNDREVGLMTEVARERFSQLTADEVADLYAYLKTRAEALQPPGAAK